MLIICEIVVSRSSLLLENFIFRLNKSSHFIKFIKIKKFYIKLDCICIINKLTKIYQKI